MSPVIICRSCLILKQLKNKISTLSEICTTALDMVIGPTDKLTVSENTIILHGTTADYNILTRATAGGPNQLGWWTNFCQQGPFWAPQLQVCVEYV